MLIKVTNILALSSLRQLLAHRQMHHVKLLIDKRFSRTKKQAWLAGLFHFQVLQQQGGERGGRQGSDGGSAANGGGGGVHTFTYGVHYILSETMTTIG